MVSVVKKQSASRAPSCHGSLMKIASMSAFAGPVQHAEASVAAQHAGESKRNRWSAERWHGLSCFHPSSDCASSHVVSPSCVCVASQGDLDPTTLSPASLLAYSYVYCPDLLLSAMGDDTEEKDAPAPAAAAAPSGGKYGAGGGKGGKRRPEYVPQVEDDDDEDEHAGPEEEP
jgi:hypothetical protein